MCWVDIETTGLNPDRDVILEIAVVLTDDALNELGHTASAIDRLVRPVERLSPRTYANAVYRWAENVMDAAVYGMHVESGLLRDLANTPGAESLLVVEANILRWIMRSTQEKCILAGSSVHFDRSFLARHMPTLNSMLHYRHVDVSTIKELARRWDLPQYEPPAEKAHRALPDVRESIAELGFYRGAIFEPELS